MRAIFRICGNESQPRLQLVGKLATPLNNFSILFQIMSLHQESIINVHLSAGHSLQFTEITINLLLTL